ncbi:hypothetical protein IW261DRAFT_1608770 [Armillaria novae-zelandiae]|uniref:Uncharacterized protein n=1 Tax=Armillaria novae-zelandiae TaxID=153914 RepID=A0AA39P6F6_9AGAR|nr:hypothetical protein IW261DRAFT_1608770 [Armillaria novae-zelandiae]
MPSPPSATIEVCTFICLRLSASTNDYIPVPSSAGDYNSDFASHAKQTNTSAASSTTGGGPKGTGQSGGKS